jgi:hypothetical protein
MMDFKCRTKQIAMLLAVLFAGAAGADIEGGFDLEPLRDPFWPVGYFPEDWKSGKTGNSDEAAV